MRDIKFRGQSINTVGGGRPIKEWVYGCLVIDESREDKYKYRIQPKEGDQFYAPPVIPETVGQYTGINDKNGTEIYEGDIISGTEHYVNTVYNNGKYRGTNEWDSEIKYAVEFNAPCLQRVLHDHSFCEVIGNIYQDLTTVI